MTNDVLLPVYNAFVASKASLKFTKNIIENRENYASLIDTLSTIQNSNLDFETPPGETLKEHIRITKNLLRKNVSLVNSFKEFSILNGNLSSEAQLGEIIKEIDDLFVLDLWATFERWLRDYLQRHGEKLIENEPTVFGMALYQQFKDEVEYWKPEDMLELLKKSFFRDLPINQQPVGHAKQILKYRNWVAHGKNQRNLSTVPNILPLDAYETLNTIIQLVEAN